MNTMGMTITEKIMAKSAEKDRVVPGESVWLNVDILNSKDTFPSPET